MNGDPRPGSLTTQGLKSRAGQVEKCLGFGALPASLIPGCPCPLIPATGGWHAGLVGLLNRQHAAAAEIQLGPGHRVWSGHMASLCGALLSWVPRDPPGFRCLRYHRSPVPYLSDAVTAGGQLFHDAPAPAVLSRGAGRCFRRCASGYWDFQPARGKVRAEAPGLGTRGWALWPEVQKVHRRAPFLPRSFGDQRGRWRN